MTQIVYIASYKSQQIHVWRFNATNNTLSLLQVVNVPGYIQPMVIHPNKYLLYVGVRPEFCIITYRITPHNGNLKMINKFCISNSPTHISIDYKGHFLFISSYQYGCISVIRLQNNIPERITDTITNIDGCHSANISSNNILWVTSLKQDCIYLFSINRNGKLITHIPAQINTVKGSGPRHMVFHPNNQYAYVINELNSSVDIWQLNDLHNDVQHIKQLDIMPINFTGVRWASDIHITPNGRYLYACDRTLSILTVFNIVNNGNTLSIKDFYYTEKQPKEFDIDSDGKFLIVAGQKSHFISLYEIQPTCGLLTKKGRYAVGQEPTWVTINTC